ncbi:Protein EARLY FLOWERING 4 [Striga hermonthica]|uniref:Protein EARLY FLOWERING 4 n=1 Tax=Striga hermonthica TaxID=68872 RepID=A0A9N7R364_STRHE|nr:Protein EARLY FLOWERING 4 [Striga hermonthica]
MTQIAQFRHCRKQTNMGDSCAGNHSDLSPKSSDGGDPAVWAAFTENFRQVQSVLDRNRVLIQQVNENHQSKIHENMVKNVALIQEINGNITKVVSLYSHLSENFSTAVHHHGEARSPGGSASEGDNK